METISQEIKAKHFWVNEIPSHWQVRRLKNIADLRFSNVDKHSLEYEKEVLLCNYLDVYNNEYITPDLAFMKATATESEIEKFKIEKGDILVTKDSESSEDIAIPAFVGVDFENIICGYHLAQIKPKKDVVDGEYVFRLFQTKPFNVHFEINATGVTRCGLSIDSFTAVHIPVPPIEEQVAIVSHIKIQSEKINHFIKKKQCFIKLLYEQKSAMISEFVTKGLSNEERKKYKIQSTGELKNTNINWVGKIPKEWKFIRTKNIFDLITEPAVIGNSEELLSVYTNIGVKPRKELEARGNRAQTTDNYWHVKKGDIIVNKLLAWMGAIGISEYDGVTSPAYDVLRLKIEGNPYYYHHLFRSTKICDEFKKYSTGIMDVRLRLYFSEFGKIPLPVPSLEEQNAIVDLIKTETTAIDLAISKEEREIVLIKEYKGAMISEAVMGKRLTLK